MSMDVPFDKLGWTYWYYPSEFEHKEKKITKNSKKSISQKVDLKVGLFSPINIIYYVFNDNKDSWSSFFLLFLTSI